MENEDNGSMQDAQRQKAIAILKRVLSRLEDRDDQSVMFLVSAAFKEEMDPKRGVLAHGAIWGNTQQLIEMVSGVTKPIVERLMGPGFVKEMEDGGQSPVHHPSEADTADMPN